MATVIRNGLVYDGLGGKPRVTDVLIRDRTIAGIGSFPSRSNHVIDASNCIVTPGIVDPASNLEWFGNPGVGYQAEVTLGSGITSCILGSSGESIVPSSSRTLNAFASRADAHSNYHWHTVPEFISHRAARAVNVGLIVGFSSLRNVMSQGMSHDLTHRELHAAVGVLRTAFDAGAFGVSIDCSRRDTSPLEVDAIIDATAKARRVLVLSTRSQENVRFKETYAYALERKVQTLVRIPWAVRRESERSWLVSVADAGDALVGTCPSGSYSISMRDLLPDWAHFPFEPHDGFTREIAERLRPYESDGLVIADPGRSEIDYLTGVPVSGFAERRGVSFSQAMLLLNSLSSGHMRFSLTRDVNVWESLAARPGVMPEWGTVDAVRSPGTFLRSISLRFPEALPQAIRNLTAVPSAFFGFDRRGTISEGSFADLVVFRDWRAETVLVNGVRASAERTDRAGVTLRSRFS